MIWSFRKFCLIKLKLNSMNETALTAASCLCWICKPQINKAFHRAEFMFSQIYQIFFFKQIETNLFIFFLRNLFHGSFTHRCDRK